MRVENNEVSNFVDANTVNETLERYRTAIREKRMNDPLGVNLDDVVGSISYADYMTLITRMNNEWIGNMRGLGRVDVVNLPASATATAPSATGEATTTGEPGS